MTSFEAPFPQKLELFKPQPDFPKEDLHDTNVPYMEQLLRHEGSDRSYAELLKGSLRQLHITGHQALQAADIKVDYSEEEYNAFCAGFAALEYTAGIVGQKLYNGELAVGKVGRLLLNRADARDTELREVFIAQQVRDRFMAWQQTHPNTHGVILGPGIEQGETMEQLQARSIGAELAWELRSA